VVRAPATDLVQVAGGVGPVAQRDSSLIECAWEAVDAWLLDRVTFADRQMRGGGRGGTIG